MTVAMNEKKAKFLIIMHLVDFEFLKLNNKLLSITCD